MSLREIYAFIWRHKIALIIFVLAVPLYLHRHQIVRKSVPYGYEKMVYLFLGWPEDWEKDVLYQPIDWESDRSGITLSYTNRYRGPKRIHLLFDKYTDDDPPHDRFFESVDFELEKSGIVVFKQSLKPKAFRYFYRDVSEGRGILLLWLEPEYAFQDYPLELKIKFNGINPIVNRFGQAYIKMINTSDL